MPAAGAISAGAGILGAASGMSSARSAKKLAKAQIASMQLRDAQFTGAANNIKTIMARRPEDAVIGFNPTQQQGFQLGRNMVGVGNSQLNGAVDRAGLLANGIGAGDISKFYNPYQQDVIDASMSDINLNRQRRQAEVGSQAQAAGAYGGDREAVLRALTNEGFDRQSAQTSAQLRSQGFDTAAGLAVQNAGIQMQGNQQLMSAVASLRAQGLDDASILAQIGGQEQGLAQRRADLPLQYQGLYQGLLAADKGAQQYSQVQQGPSVLSGALSGLQGGLQFGSQLGSLFGVGGKPTGGMTPGYWGTYNPTINVGTIGG